MIGNKYTKVDKKQGKPNRPGYITLLMNRASKSALEGLDLLAKASTIMKPVRFLQKIGKIASEDLLKELEDNPITRTGENLGLYRDYIPEGYKEKFAANLGDITGSILTSGPIGALRNPKAIAQTVGGMITQAGLQPIIEEKLKNYPKIQAGANILSGLMGSTTAGSMFKSNQLPGVTAAMTETLKTPRSNELIRKSKELAKTDKKFAQQLDQVVTGIQNKVKERFTPENKLTGSQIIEHILDHFDNLRTMRREDYTNKANEIFKDFTGKINLSRYKEAIKEAKGKVAEGGGIEDAIIYAENLINKNKNIPVKLNQAKSELQAAIPGNVISIKVRKNGKEEIRDITLNERQAAVIKGIGHNVKEDIAEAIPAMKPVNHAYDKVTDEINKLEKGVVGKSVSKAKDEPSKIFERIFEKTDKEKIKEFKEILPENLYNDMADHYLNDVIHTNLGEATRSQTNMFSQFYKVRSKLQKKNDQLKATLPQDRYNKVQETIEDITMSERGVPHTEYLTEPKTSKGILSAHNISGAIQNVAGHAVLPGIGYGLGYLTEGHEGGAKGALVGAGMSAIGRPMASRMRRNEILFGKTPAQQLLHGTGDIAQQGIPQAIMAKNLGNKPIPIELPKTLSPQEEEKVEKEEISPKEKFMSFTEWNNKEYSHENKNEKVQKKEPEHKKDDSIQNYTDWMKENYKDSAQQQSMGRKKEYKYHPLLKFNPSGIGASQKRG